MDWGKYEKSPNICLEGLRIIQKLYSGFGKSKTMPRIKTLSIKEIKNEIEYTLHFFIYLFLLSPAWNIIQFPLLPHQSTMHFSQECIHILYLAGNSIHEANYMEENKLQTPFHELLG